MPIWLATIFAGGWGALVTLLKWIFGAREDAEGEKLGQAEQKTAATVDAIELERAESHAQMNAETASRAEALKRLEDGNA